MAETPVGDPVPTLVAHDTATKVYKIKKGDTIHQLAMANHTTDSKILEMNHGVNPNKLRIGQPLELP